MKSPSATSPTVFITRPGIRQPPTRFGQWPAAKTAGWYEGRSGAERIRGVPDEDLWQLRTASTQCLVDYARERLARHYAAAGASSETIEEAKHLFDPKVLTIGFARRFASYKRPNLLLHDPERFLRLLSNPQRPCSS